MEQTTSTNLFDLQVDAPSQSLLGETAKWAKFVAIMSFIFVGIMVIIMMIILALAANTPAFSEASNLQVVGAGVMATVTVIVAILVVVPNIYLLRFAIRLQMALRNNDQPSLISAFSNIKSCYKFVGITYIVLVALWVLSFIYDAMN